MDHTQSGWTLLDFVFSFPVRILEKDGLMDPMVERESTCIHLNGDLRLFQLVMILHLPAPTGLGSTQCFVPHEDT